MRRAGAGGHAGPRARLPVGRAATGANQLVGRIKGKSARLLRQEFPELQRMPSIWTRSYFVSTAGNVSSETIAKYIAEQTTRD